LIVATSGVTRGLSQGASLAKGAQPSLKYEIIGRNYNEIRNGVKLSIPIFFMVRN